MEVWNNRLLLAEGDWPEVGKAADSVRRLFITRLVENRAIPAAQGIAYWTSVPQSVSSASLLYLQHSPAWLLRSVCNVQSCRTYWINAWRAGWHARLAVPEGKDRTRATSYEKDGGSVLAVLKRYIGEVSAYVVCRFRSVRYVYMHLAKRISEERLSELSQIQDSTAHSIGNLLIAADSVNLDAKQDVQQLIVNISEAIGVQDASVNTPQEALQTLQDLLEASQHFVPVKTTKGKASVLSVDPFPSFLTRYWPALALSVLAGWKLAGSWEDLVAWVNNSVVETVRLFWKNWIVDPLFKIYLTIRHDPSNEVALVAKESLSSDISSLERMVVDFASDMNPQLSSAELAEIGTSASRGNVTPVMSVYEKQISKPITNLVTGKLIRTLLIQVQKSKVDLEVALSGIDQLLQSQQLVFGIVAATPAIVCGFWILRLSTSGIWSSVVRRGQVRQPAVAQGLLTLDRTIQSAPSTLRASDIGLIYSIIYLIRAELDGHRSLAQTRLFQQLDCLEQNAVSTRSAATALADLDRAYSRYYLSK